MKVWDEFLQGSAQELGPEAIEKWAKTLKVVDFDAANLYLEAQDAFQVNWFEDHLRPLIKTSFKNNNYRPIKVHLTLANSLKEKKIWKPVLSLTPDPLHSACTWQSYFPGEANKLSFALLQEAIEKASYNPIYLHGLPGCGKSHLLMAIANGSKKSCLYVTADTLTNHIVAAMKTGGMQKFREFYRQHEMLLVDDIHQLAHRTATQEELFHTFNTLHVAGKQIVLSGNKLPSKLDGIEPRLTSRFEWGLVLPFVPLSEKERGEFLQGKVADVEMLKELTSMPMVMRGIELVKQRKSLAPLLEEQKRRAVTPQKIVQATAEVYEIRAADILGRAQNQECSLPRQVAMYLCRMMLRMPFLKIAEVFSRDHSTVMTSVKNVEKKIREQDNVMLSTLDQIKLKIKS